MKSRKVSIQRRWLEPPPVRPNGTPIPKSQWPRKRRHKWVIRWFAADGSRPQVTVDNKTDAEQVAAEKQVEFDKSPTARKRPNRITIGDFAEQVQQDRIGPRGQRLSTGSLAVYRVTLSKFQAFISADTRLADIGNADAARFIVWLQNRKLSKASVNRAKRTIKAVFNLAIQQHGYIRHNPFAKVKADKLADKAIRYVAPAEFQALVQAAGSITESQRAEWSAKLMTCYPYERDRFQQQIAGIDRRRLWWQAFIALCYTAGTRKNEAIHLTWADVDFEADTIRVIAKPAGAGLHEWQPKDKDSRTIPIPTLTVDLLAKLQTVAEEGNPYVLIPTKRLDLIKATQATGQCLDGADVVNNIWRDWSELVKAAKIEHATIHDLRRSAITNWARVLPIHVTQELAGHASIETTRRYYLSVTAGDLDNARAAAADAIEGVVPHAAGAK